MDQHDVVIVGVEGRQAVRVLSLRVAPPATTDQGSSSPVVVRAASVASTQSGWATTTRRIDARPGQAAGTPRQDGLARQADELLGDVGTELVAVPAGQEQCVDPHRTSSLEGASWVSGSDTRRSAPMMRAVTPAATAEDRLTETARTDDPTGTDAPARRLHRLGAHPARHPDPRRRTGTGPIAPPPATPRWPPRRVDGADERPSRRCRRRDPVQRDAGSRPDAARARRVACWKRSTTMAGRWPSVVARPGQPVSGHAPGRFELRPRRLHRDTGDRHGDGSLHPRPWSSARRSSIPTPSRCRPIPGRCSASATGSSAACGDPASRSCTASPG